MALDNIPGKVRSVPSSAEEGGRATLKDLSERVESLGIWCVSRCGGPIGELGGIPSRLDHVNVAKVGESVVDGLAKGGEDLDVVWVCHALEVGVRGKTDPDSLLPNSIGTCLNDLKGKANTVLDGSTIVVGTVVAG